MQVFKPEKLHIVVYVTPASPIAFFVFHISSLLLHRVKQTYFFIVLISFGKCANKNISPHSLVPHLSHCCSPVLRRSLSGPSWLQSRRIFFWWWAAGLAGGSSCSLSSCCGLQIFLESKLPGPPPALGSILARSGSVLAPGLFLRNRPQGLLPPEPLQTESPQCAVAKTNMEQRVKKWILGKLILKIMFLMNPVGGQRPGSWDSEIWLLIKYTLDFRWHSQ